MEVQPLSENQKSTGIPSNANDFLLDSQTAKPFQASLRKTEEEFQAEQIATDARFQSCGGNEDVKGFVLLTILCSCSAERA